MPTSKLYAILISIASIVALEIGIVWVSYDKGYSKGYSAAADQCKAENDKRVTDRDAAIAVLERTSVEKATEAKETIASLEGRLTDILSRPEKVKVETREVIKYVPKVVPKIVTRTSIPVECRNSTTHEPINDEEMLIDGDFAKAWNAMNVEANK